MSKRPDSSMPADPRPSDDLPSLVNDGIRQVVAENVKWWRQNRGLSQEQLAVRSGLTRETVRGVENTTNDARLSTLGQLAIGLRVDPEWLASEKDLEERQRAAKQMGWTVEPARQQPLLVAVKS